MEELKSQENTERVFNVREKVRVKRKSTREIEDNWTIMNIEDGKAFVMRDDGAHKWVALEELKEWN